MKLRIGWIGVLLLSCQTAIAQEDDWSDLTPEQKAFFEDDSFFKAMAVNEGNLQWVTPQQTENQYALKNAIVFFGDSLQTRKVGFTQCHENLDAIHAIDIVYNAETTSELKVISATNIERHQTHSAKVELFNVSKGAKICIQGINQTLNFDPTSNSWQLKRGPYMRKFLDGYYPMHLQEVLDLSKTSLGLQSIQPQLNAQKMGLESLPAGKISELPLPKITQQGKDIIQIDYWFEGRLQPIYQFSKQD